MLSAVKRYKLLVTGALTRCFPRTAEYLQSGTESALFRRWPDDAAASAAKAARKTKPKTKTNDGTPTPAKPRAKPRKAAGEGIYSATALTLEDAQVQAMREQVGKAVAAGLVGAPSDEQWAMILARSPVTRVFAGAGSGKSTTLLLRLVFMLCHLGVAPDRLTVISFTNASCAELRQQLLRLLGFWQFPFDEAQARQCVRTFHSAMGVLAREVLGATQWFEQLAERSVDELDNPLAGGRLRPAQQRLLRQAYQDCYAADAEFRQRVHELLGLPAPDVPAPGKRVAKARAPLDGFRLAGEFTPLPLFEAFYAQAGFIESIGIRIDQLQLERVDCGPRERSFLQALQQFWRALEANLQAQGLLTFNGAFQQLTQRLAAGEAVSDEALAPFTHLLIDEFQDISPLIVQWLQALHRRLAGRGEAVSLMAIGDDWQSIYGWRGSSPELFIDFDRYFPRRGNGKSAVLLLETNYRSIEAVIRDGEAVLAGVACKQAKTSKAGRAMQPGDHGVKLVTGFQLDKSLPRLLDEIRAQCEHAASLARPERTAVLLLSRRNEPLRAIQAQLDRKLPVRACTIHRAKGLQAQVAIILDDCLPADKHPLRNALYAYCGFFRNSYDQAMADENLRLAYVAITRGVSRVLWYTRKPQGATQLLAGRGKR
jgi:superfamily I DNA/RNA helicase